MYQPDVLWIDKGVYLRLETLRFIKRKTKSFILHHTTDDILNKINKFDFYLKALDLYDVHFTSNLSNIDEMQKMTINPVVYNELGYDDRFFRHVDLEEKDEWLNSEIFFIGHWEPRTELFIRALVDYGLPVAVRGHGWAKGNNRGLPGGIVRSGAVHASDYVKAINAGKIGLGIVSEWNRNETASRIFEITACGTMLLAMRTGTIERLYEDGKEIALFSNPQELVSKAKYYLEHEEVRKAIAEYGRTRCVKNRCSWKDRIVEILLYLEGIGIH